MCSLLCPMHPPSRFPRFRNQGPPSHHLAHASPSASSPRRSAAGEALAVTSEDAALSPSARRRRADGGAREDRAGSVAGGGYRSPTACLRDGVSRHSSRPRESRGHGRSPVRRNGVRRRADSIARLQAGKSQSRVCVDALTGTSRAVSPGPWRGVDPSGAIVQTAASVHSMRRNRQPS
jgi:hypothetical protein